MSVEEASGGLKALSIQQEGQIESPLEEGEAPEAGQNDSGGAPAADLSQHGELWLQEIEAVDDYWGPTFRAVYESSWQEGFMELLERRVGQHDQEIEKMCNHHYQGFISSVRELLTVRADAAKLRADVTATDQAARQTAERMATAGRDLVSARRTERNIAVTIESLSLCLPVLQMFTKLKRQMAERRYHPALKTLEQLEHTFLPRIANYRFSRHMRESIPRLREAIKEASVSELKDFLEAVRKYSPKIGEMAMRRTAARLNLAAESGDYLDANEAVALSAGAAEDGGLLKPATPRRKAQVAPQPNPFTGEVDYEGQTESEYEAEEDLCAQDLVDFSPVYKCLHIHTVLGEREAFEKYYRKQRRQQATLTLQPPSSMGESVEGYKAYFHGIVGFFVCEDHVLATGNGLVTRGYLDDLWAATSARVLSTLQAHSALATGPALMLRVKGTVLLFSATLQRHGLTSDKMLALLQELRDHYTEVLMQGWVQRFRDIFDEDNYHPMQVRHKEYLLKMTFSPY